MSKFGRYAMRAVLGLGLGLGLIGCGGTDDPSERIENESGVLLTVNGVAEFDAGGSDTTVVAQTLAQVGLFFTNQEKKQSASPTMTITKARNVPIDSTDAENTSTYTLVQLLPSIAYINNRLSTIDFSLNQAAEGEDGPRYGYDFVVRSVGDAPEEFWRASTMMDWCLSLSPDDFAEDFTIVTEYQEPSTLLAAETWLMGEDARYQSCPSTLRNFLVLGWLGIDMDNIQESVADFVADRSGDPPTFAEVIEYVLENAVYNDGLLDTTDTVQVELAVELYMNEFELLGEPFVFTVNVKDFDYSTISSQ